MSFVVAIDGPAGSGKGTVTKLVGEKLKLANIDTGAMYRCVTLECLNRNIKSTDLENINKILENIDIKFKKDINGENRVFLSGEDVSKEIRTPRVNENVSEYSSVKIIRNKITPLQRKMGENNNIIMEGRDIGTAVFPNADVKIFLDVSLEESAKRRYKQNLEKGIETSYEIELENLKRRNKYDSEREVVPFKQAEDAIYLDSTNLTIEQVVEKILEIIKEKGYEG